MSTIETVPPPPKAVNGQPIPGFQSGKVPAADDAQASARETRPRARTREAASTGLRASTRAGTKGLARLRALLRLDVYLDGRPDTIRQVWQYSAAGGWVPGEKAFIVEFWGYVYGFCVAVPTTAAAYLATWLVQRPTRVIGFVVIATIAKRWVL